MNFKTFVFLAVYWSIRTSSYNTDIEVQPFLKWSLHNVMLGPLATSRLRSPAVEPVLFAFSKTACGKELGVIIIEMLVSVLQTRRAMGQASNKQKENISGGFKGVGGGACNRRTPPDKIGSTIVFFFNFFCPPYQNA